MTLAEKTSTPARPKARAAARPAEIVREYGPFPGADKVAGVSHDGERVWIAGGAQLIAFDPASGQVARTLPRAGCGPDTAAVMGDAGHLVGIRERSVFTHDLGCADGCRRSLRFCLQGHALLLVTRLDRRRKVNLIEGERRGE